MRGRRFGSEVLLAFAGVLSLVMVGVPAPVGAAELKGIAKVGYDTFIDRFTILEVGTRESIQEYYGGLGGSLAIGSAARINVTNLFKVGSQTIDDDLDFVASTAPGRRVASFQGSLRWQHFQPGSDYQFRNDNVRSNAFLSLRSELGRRLRLNLKSRFESANYREKTSFDYDYRYADAGLELEAGSAIDRMVLVGGYLGFRDATDTSALDYRRSITELEARLSSPSGVMLRIASIGDRRSYHGDVRSSYWSFTSFVDLGAKVPRDITISLRGESELFLFDRQDSIFFNTHFVRGGLRARYAFGPASGLFIEPRYARLLCESFPEERYAEATAVVGVDYLRAGGLWLTASYEPGYHDYTADPNNLYSDYTVNRISVMASIPLVAGSTLNLFLTHDPEKHSRPDDDFSVTLFSADVTKRF